MKGTFSFNERHLVEAGCWALCQRAHCVWYPHIPHQDAHPLCDVDKGSMLPSLQKLLSWDSGTLSLGHTGDTYSLPPRGWLAPQIQKMTGVEECVEASGWNGMGPCIVLVPQLCSPPFVWKTSNQDTFLVFLMVFWSILRFLISPFTG